MTLKEVLYKVFSHEVSNYFAIRRIFMKALICKFSNLFECLFHTYSQIQMPEMYGIVTKFVYGLLVFIKK